MKRGIAAVTLLAAACTAAQASDAAHVSMGEFYMQPSASLLTAGMVDISVSNNGEYPHTFVLTDESGRVVTASDLVAAGEEASFTIELTPGRYAFTCRIVAEKPDGSVIDHYEAGMAATVEVVP